MDRPGFRLALQLPRKYRCMDGCLACCIWVHLAVDAGIFTKGESHLSTGVKTPKRKSGDGRGAKTLNLLFVNVVFFTFLHFRHRRFLCFATQQQGKRDAFPLFPHSLFPSSPVPRGDPRLSQHLIRTTASTKAQGAFPLHERPELCMQTGCSPTKCPEIARVRKPCIPRSYNRFKAHVPPYVRGVFFAFLFSASSAFSLFSAPWRAEWASVCSCRLDLSGSSVQTRLW